MIDKTHVLQLVLSHFTVVRVVNGVYYCICPGHSDNKPSLHISMGDIKIILDCKAKCNYKKILDKIGMKPEELYYDYYDKNRKQGNRMSPKQYGYEKNCIDKYPYFRMDNGQQTHIQYKMPGKRYPQGYNNNGEWVSTLKDIDTHLSIFCNVSIEKLKQEAKQGKHLIYAEGAKDVKTCGKYGLIGFTCGSSGDWKKKKEVFKYIKNAVLIIFADNDEPGINSANGIKLYYEQLGGRATVIIPPGVSQKGDISDYMETHTKEELYELVENALNSTVTEKNLLPEVSQVEVERLLSYKGDYDKDGNVKSKKILQTVRNFEIIMENDTRFVGKIKFDEFSQQTFLMGSVPWESKKNYRAWGSYDDSALFSILQSDYGMNSRNDYFDALKNVAMKNKFHPVRDILDSLVWDGEDHIRNLLPDYLGVEDTEYQYQVMKLWMMGAVSRIYKPGCKFDYTVIFKGRQGLGKSTFLQLLALNDNWFNDSLDSLDSDKAAQSLMGSWIIELAELKSLARTAGGVDSVKRFLTATQDKYRVPYERRADIFLRQCVFAGTTNKEDFLQDETGNRRFLIIEAGVNEPRKNLFESESINDFKAAWAQAVYIVKNEKPKLILPDSCRKRAEELQAESMSDDGKVGIIQEYLSDKQRTCAIEIWREALQETGRPAKWQASEINNIVLSFPEWKRMQYPAKFGTYGSQRGFQKCSLQSQNEDDSKQECSQGFMNLTDSELSELPFD